MNGNIYASLGALLAIAAFVVVPASASAEVIEPPNWTVNGVPLKPGESKPVKVASVTPMTITVPGLGLTVVCSKVKGAGTVIGAETSESAGGGWITTLMSKPCKTPAEPCKVLVYWYNDPDGSEKEFYQETDGYIGETVHWWFWENNQHLISEGEGGWMIVSGNHCGHVGSYEMTGSVDSNWLPSQELEFPVEPLPTSTLKVGGYPAVLSGTDTMKLTDKKDTLGMAYGG